MDKSYLIERIERDCPLCNKVHLLEKRRRESVMLIKNEEVKYEETYFFCPNSVGYDEDEFVSAEMMDYNLQNARNAYRKAHGLLTSYEIAEVRALYGMSQSDLALLLGWGEVTITRYETKAIQDETYDQLIRMVKDDPYYALRCLKKQKEHFSVGKYEDLAVAIINRIDSIGVEKMILKNIENRYAEYDTPCDFNGYQVLDISKLGAVMAFFAQYCKNLYKVKLMKLLWYADALSYQKRNHAITGLVYQHMPYGALPIANVEIINLPQLDVEEIEKDDGVIYHIQAKRGMTLDALTPDEIDIIYAVAKKFDNVKTKDIVEYMHKEEAYKETEMFQIIPFSLCKKLNQF
ncbi:MAG: DUF4065 domain-containing protein [Spirochaetales bacterium]|nr:DUF4065 domain-containing protein [Spirochaetales bacterium]